MSYNPQQSLEKNEYRDVSSHVFFWCVFFDLELSEVLSIYPPGN